MNSERMIDLFARKESNSVAILSELEVDAHTFNVKAWENSLAFFRKNRWINGVIADGWLTRLDRPEVLDDRLTFWTKSEAECAAASLAVKNRERLQYMLGIQLEILKERLTELRQAVGPKAQVVFSARDDEIQNSLSALLNEILLLRDQECEEKIGELHGKRSALQQQSKALVKTRKNLEKNVKPGEKPKMKISRKLAGTDKQLQDLGAVIGKLDGEIAATRQEQMNYREKKEGPKHQYETRKLVECFFSSINKICKPLNVQFTHKDGLLTFGDLVVDYSHSRHKTWASILRIEECLVTGTHGKLNSAQQEIGPALKELIAAALQTHPDAIIESGHHGKGFERSQRLVTYPDEMNFKNNMKFYTGRKDEIVKLVCALPFYDQEAVARFVRGEEPVRMSGGKPLHSRSHAMFNRYHNNSVSGMTIISKYVGAPTGMVSTRWIQYDDFVTGAVLNQPDHVAAIFMSSDEHIGARESLDMVREGFINTYRHYLVSQFMLGGSTAQAYSYISAGDGADGTHLSWQHLRSSERNPHELLRENFVRFAKLNPKNLDEVLELSLKCVNDSKGGTVESMRVIMRWLADYYDQLLLPTLEASPHRFALVTTNGNHGRKLLERLGLMDWDLFAERCMARGIGVYESVDPDYYKDDPLKGVRVGLGGNSSASGIFIKNYGEDVNGKLIPGMRERINVGVQHDPKSYSGDGVVNCGRSSGADLFASGHSHDGYGKCDKTGENRFRFAKRLPAFTGMTPTELFYAGVPRTAGAAIVSMTKPGDVTELTIPAAVFERIGWEARRSELAELMKEDGKTGNSAK